MLSNTRVQVPSLFSVVLVNEMFVGPLPVSIVGEAPVPQSASPEIATGATGHRPSGRVSVTTRSAADRYSPVWIVRVVFTKVPWMTCPVTFLRITRSSAVTVSVSVSTSVGLVPEVDGPWKVPTAVRVLVTSGSEAVSDVAAPLLLSRLRP